MNIYIFIKIEDVGKISLSGKIFYEKNGYRVKILLRSQCNKFNFDKDEEIYPSKMQDSIHESNDIDKDEGL